MVEMWDVAVTAMFPVAAPLSWLHKAGHMCLVFAVLAGKILHLIEVQFW